MKEEFGTGMLKFLSCKRRGGCLRGKSISGQVHEEKRTDVKLGSQPPTLTRTRSGVGTLGTPERREEGTLKVSDLGTSSKGKKWTVMTGTYLTRMGAGFGSCS